MRKIYLALALLCLSAQANALTLKQLISRTRQYIGDTPYYTPTPKLTDQRIKDFLNEGQKFASSYEWMSVSRVSFTLLANTTEYFLPVDFQTVKKIYLNGKPLPETTLDALDANMNFWLSPSGTPNKYYVRFASVSVIGFLPWPTASGAIVTMDYNVIVGDMVSLNDQPFNGAPEFAGLHEALCKYAVYRYLMSTGNGQVADIWGKEFLSDVKRMVEIIGTKPNYRPGAVADEGGQRQ